MVVWVFAGGGESEIGGLIPFLAKWYTVHTFERKSPVRLKPGPRPPDRMKPSRRLAIKPGHGRTGKSLAEQIDKILYESLKGKESCDLILVIDDLDCHDPDDQRKLFVETIRGVDGAADIPSFIGFASPEIEAWIVADWDNTIAKDSDFSSRQLAMRHRLSTQKSVLFDSPETFSSFDQDRDSCREKLSDAIVESSIHCSARERYSKAIHTARFLQQISPKVVSRECPLFRELNVRLSQTQ